MTSKHEPARFLLLGSLFAGTAVAAGAFGAHMLKGMLDAPMLAVFETAARYQMYHGLGLCIVALAMQSGASGLLSKTGWLFTAGIVLFCGSLYGVSLAGIRWLGAVTPLGGVSFMAGWALLVWQAWQRLHSARQAE